MMVKHIVEMPVKEDWLSLLRRLRENASERSNYLLKRFARSLTMKSLYEDFSKEYNKLGHSRKIAKKNNFSFSYYLPHYDVFRSDKSSTKLGVVFDVTALMTTGISLNDVLLNGGLVQDKLFDIIYRFRAHKFAFTADIVKIVLLDFD
ncbi:uncharacterized protein LOC118182888 [Stegodyphus dumicola]|uniref:uncharacterized protein LOC118182888 n=1 Tax=Stegodyphus dumicola TaxID=202533 RepID=UPI0015AD543D|nr:uncharacterized protein LOC118182888 [Stegodyphus dumicola]